MSSSSPEIVLTSSPDGPIIAYDISNGTKVAHFTGSRSPPRGLILAGESFFAASHVSPDKFSGSVHLYNWYTLTAFHNMPVPELVAPLTATLDGSYLFAGGLSGTIHVLSLPNGDVLNSFPAHKKPISCLELNDDGSLLISGSDDGTIVIIPIIQVLDAFPGDKNPNLLVLHRLFAHAKSVTAITSGKGIYTSTLISCSLDSTCKFWNLLCGTHLRTVTFPCSISGVVFDPVESDFYAAGSDGLIYKGSMKVPSKELKGRGHELVSWGQKHDGSIVSLVIVNQGRNLVSAAEDGSVWLWGIEKGEVILVLGSTTMTSISSMVVTRGVRYGKGSVGSGTSSFTSGFSDKELISRPVKEILKIGDLMTGIDKDRSRAIDILESAISMYERLLELILEEARKGTSSNGGEAGEI
ncbi:Protein ROOT INITIATION DEFECTIVE 3 [Quillaja saponaria]|uniref:Protein ROOT INITIATION DEFECTIVE 3 n=1 Tax=Quillaja saponaria TaxID=32244 RepID=A0AAD7KZP9_QUISA|nr:Protein ROOT INITIATION DEFECTIVE 3 [Quillaja saponaria]